MHAGPGSFLAHFELQAELAARDAGPRTFVGWKILRLIGPAEQWAGIDIHPGDVVTRVNGFSIEREDDFYRVFQSLSVASEIRVALLREGRPIELRWRVVD